MHDGPGGTQCLVCGGRDLSFVLRARQWNVAACSQCSHRQLAPPPDATTLTALYGEGYFKRMTTEEGGYGDYLGNATGWRRTAARRVTRLARMTTGRRLLDVGTACGFFVEQARMAGFDASGVETSGWAAEWGRTHLHVPITTGTLDDVPASATFDVVCAWEVIEHVLDPAAFVRAATGRLAPGGYFVISTPDYAARVPRLFGKRWIGWDKVPEHISFFSRQSLLALLERHDLTVEGIHYASTHVSLAYLIDRLSTQITGRSINTHESILNRLTLPINPGWDLEVICRIT
jgi:cyclopropane fatty-acyl-phospholipid synthase-like methyltransferase